MAHPSFDRFHAPKPHSHSAPTFHHSSLLFSVSSVVHFPLFDRYLHHSLTNHVSRISNHQLHPTVLALPSGPPTRIMSPTSGAG